MEKLSKIIEDTIELVANSLGILIYLKWLVTSYLFMFICYTTLTLSAVVGLLAIFCSSYIIFIDCFFIHDICK